MNTIATATLQTPWDCRWSQFGRMRSTDPVKRTEGLWVCLYGSRERRPVTAAQCENCPHWEYEPPLPARVP